MNADTEHQYLAKGSSEAQGAKPCLKACAQFSAFTEGWQNVAQWTSITIYSSCKMGIMILADRRQLFKDL